MDIDCVIIASIAVLLGDKIDLRDFTDTLESFGDIFLVEVGEHVRNI
jgi:hypothetical protein